jgi:hypothetical protein
LTGLRAKPWGLSLVRQDIALFQLRKRSGDIGAEDVARERKLIAFMRSCLLKPVPPSYQVPSGMRENGIIPRADLQVRATGLWYVEEGSPVAGAREVELTPVKLLKDFAEGVGLGPTDACTSAVFRTARICQSAALPK